MYLWSIVAARDLHLISPTRRRAHAARRRRSPAIEHLRKWNGFLLSWYDTSNGAVLTGPGAATSGRTTRSTASSSPRSTAAGTRRRSSSSGSAFPQFRDRATSAARRDGLRHLLRRPRPVERHHRRADVRRLDRRQRPGRLPLREPEHRDAHRRVHRHRHARDARRRLVADVAHAAAELRLADAAAAGPDGHRPRPAVGQGVRRLRGPLLLRRHRLRPELGRKRVRGADAQPRRAGDQVGAARASARTTATTRWRRSPTRKRRSHYPVWGLSPGEHARRHRRLRRVRRSPARLEPRLLPVRGVRA